MLSWLFLIIILIAFIIVGTWAFGALFGQEPFVENRDQVHDPIAENRAVLARGDVDEVAFDVVTQGYRQDQVDDVISILQRRIAELEAGDTTGASALPETTVRDADRESHAEPQAKEQKQLHNQVGQSNSNGAR